LKSYVRNRRNVGSDYRGFGAAIFSQIAWNSAKTLKKLGSVGHRNAGNKYDSLMNKTRIFWSIECWQIDSDEILTEKLKYLSEQKDNLNQSCPQIPRIAYNWAKKGIAAGEAKYKVDEG